ncbi:hypothetical protein [Alloprevotella tannerae]|uniref:hypothetical protein n=1 Tax=Alloprevotella tannerae TaxID=76122 RepID=UPI0028892171|nr:hypothetical protein [Alloprevotella tannerae]
MNRKTENSRQKEAFLKLQGRFDDCLAPPNHRLVPANHRLARANYRLLPANNGRQRIDASGNQ